MAWREGCGLAWSSHACCDGATVGLSGSGPAQRRKSVPVRTAYLTRLAEQVHLQDFRDAMRHHLYRILQALSSSWLFYEAQISGRKPPWSRIAWRGDAHLSDTVVGGWYVLNNRLLPGN